ncbi:hypothetical protein ACFVFS_19425 [Kitasatospora sp. NPDC057692]|uniref:hypothetical protein n=1 Tax=Kitasatospora sp. NPDC057692 TaxID=3346215 RepID=UPI0036787A86
MDLTTLLAAIGGLVLLLGAIARLPTAAAEVVRACIPLLKAVAELRAAARRAFRSVPSPGMGPLPVPHTVVSASSKDQDSPLHGVNQPSEA